MNNDIVILREAIKKLIPMIAGRGLRVTQMGTQAYVAPNPQTGLPERVNIPNIPDNATTEFVQAIQGFIDHEVAHVLYTDFLCQAGKKSARLHNLHNIVEDTRIERFMANDFPGSRKNIDRLSRYFVENVTAKAIASAKDPMEEFQYLIVVMMRALAGHVPFQEFMDDNNYWDHPLVKAFLAKFPETMRKRMPHLASTQEAFDVAVEMEKIIYPPPPPTPPQPEPEDDEDDQQDQSDDQKGDDDKSQDDGEGDDETEESGEPEKGDGEAEDDADSSNDENEGEQSDDASGDSDKDEEDEEEGEDGKGKGEREHTDETDSDQASGGEEDEEEENDAEDGDSESGKGSAGGDTAQDDDGEAEQSDGEDDKEDDAGDAGDDGDDDRSGDETDGDTDDDAQPDEGDDAEGQPSPEDEDGDEGGEGDPADTDADADSDEDDEGADGDGDDGETGNEDADGSDEDLNGNQDVAIEHDPTQETGKSSEDAGDNQIQGVGYDGHDPFREMKDDALDEVDISSSIAIIIQRHAIEALSASDYSVFTREHDLIKPLEVPAEFSNKRVTEMDEETRAMTGVMQKDIERMMAAQSRVFNIAGQRSGRLSGAGLHRLVANDPRVFSKREEIRAKDTAVVLLNDCSGSMRGSKVSTAMASSYALSSTLERVNIPHEVIGFTTGGHWGCQIIPHHVGQRVKDLANEDTRKSGVNFCRTVPIYMPIFKEFQERLNSEVKRRFAYMRHVQPNLGANVDGESLEYAAMRLATRKEKRKVIIVLSDGFPAGARNDAEHLRMMTTKLTKMGFDLVGIGIESDAVERFYDNHLVLQSVTELPGAVMGKLRAILQK